MEEERRSFKVKKYVCVRMCACAPVRVMRFSNIRITFVVDQLVRDHVQGAAQVTRLIQIQH
jgi:hypothetical protein